MIIGIDFGHTLSGSNYGAVGILKESEETRNLGNRVIKYLSALGHTVVNCSVDSAASNNASLTSRVNKANAQALDLFVSIHFNAGGGKGTEVFTYNGNKHVEATRILSNIESIGFVNRGVKDGSGLYVVKNTKAKSMLLEVCFVDTKTDVDLYKSNIDKVAIAIVEGITGQKVKIENNQVNNLEVKDIIKTAVHKENLIAKQMVEEIKLLQGTVGIDKDGIGTDNLCKMLPNILGHEQRGIVTVMQRILIAKGFLSKDSDTGTIGQANKDAIGRFKVAMGIPQGNILVDATTWFKLIEY